MARFKKDDLKRWLQYWDRKMVNLSAIQSPSDVTEARKWCPCMNVGRFWDVTDRQFWDALVELRAELGATPLVAPRLPVAALVPNVGTLT